MLSEHSLKINLQKDMHVPTKLSQEKYNTFKDDEDKLQKVFDEEFRIADTDDF